MNVVRWASRPGKPSFVVLSGRISTLDGLYEPKLARYGPRMRGFSSDGVLWKHQISIAFIGEDDNIFRRGQGVDCEKAASH